ncbi:YceI family protein [Halalkalibaculum sp. DA3122]
MAGSINANAQNNAYTLLSESSMTIEGTSTIHDWEADVEEMKLTADLSENLFESAVPASAEFIKALSFSAVVESIESGKGGMNNKIYDALKEKDHPEITYTLSEAELVSSDESTGTFTLDTTGELTVAGTTQTISFPVEGTLSDGENVRFQGSYSLNMKDYDVDPPSAVFGTIKAGEEVTISFNVVIANKAVANN